MADFRVLASLFFLVEGQFLLKGGTRPFHGKILGHFSLLWILLIGIFSAALVIVVPYESIDNISPTIRLIEI